MGFWSSCWGLPMLAEMTCLKGKSESPLDRRARNSSDLTASSPRTAYSGAPDVGVDVVWSQSHGRRVTACLMLMLLVGRVGGCLTLVGRQSVTLRFWRGSGTGRAEGRREPGRRRQRRL